MLIRKSRDAAIPLPNFDSTNIWSSQGAAINSSDAFHTASRLEEQAYVANHWLFIAVMIVLGSFIVRQIPHAIIRIRSSPSWWYNFRLQKAAAVRAYPKPPYRLRHLTLTLPALRVPFFNLSLTQFLLVLALWSGGVGVAAWCQMDFLTDASRSTLVVMFFLALTAGLGTKAGGIGTWITSGYTAVNFLHRWAGRLVLLLSLLHVTAYLTVFYKAGIAKQEMAKPANYLGAVAFGGLCLTGIASMGCIRRRWWLAFKFGHHFGILLLLAGLNYHSHDVVPYLIAIWGLVVINSVFRSVTTRLTTANLQCMSGAESTLVTFPDLKRGFTAGQHVRLRLLHLGWKHALESHPFTIASADTIDGSGIQLIVKQSGDWTDSLYNLAIRQPGPIRCFIEGPYGGPINFIFPAFSSVLIAVGGSGVSFGLGVVQDLLSQKRQGTAKCKHLTMVWVVRQHANLIALRDHTIGMLSLAHEIECTDPDFVFQLKFFHTAVARREEGISHEKNSEALIEDPQIHIMNERPDWKAILDNIVTCTPDNGGVGIGACGTAGMVDCLGNIVRQVPSNQKARVGGIEIHLEHFSL